MRSSWFRLPHPCRIGALAFSTLISCHNLDGFSTKPGQAYCGPMISLPSFTSGFVPRNSPPSLDVALTLDIDKLTSIPGILSSDDAKTGLCSATGQPLFQDAPLRAIPEVDHDAISQLTFGEGHEQDFFAFVDSTCQGTMVAVVSLLKNNQVELRLFKPARLPSDDTSPDQPGFALFPLTANERATPTDTPEELKRNCGF